MKPDRDALLWTLPGAALGLVFLSLPSIGLLVWPVAGLIGLVVARVTDGRGAYGAPVGFGVLLAAICLPQPAFVGIGAFGVVAALGGIAVCVIAHRASA